MDPIEARYQHATTLLAQARYPEALAAFDALLPEVLDAATAHQARAVALYRLERCSEALQACEQALRLRPNFAVAHHIKAGVLHALGRLPEALAACTDALAHGGTSADKARPTEKTADREVAVVANRKAAAPPLPAKRGRERDVGLER